MKDLEVASVVRGVAPSGGGNLRRPGICPQSIYQKGETFMAHLNPLEKEFLIRRFRLNGRIKLSDFCTLHNVSDAAFRKQLKQYDEGGLEGLSRADAEFREVLPERIASANHIFDLVYQEEITDERLVATTRTPADSVEMLVWYWASMYCWDTQDYKQSLNCVQYALPFAYRIGDRDR